MRRRPLRSIGRDRRGLAALEFASVVPMLLITVMGILALNDLVASRRALDFGIERALRYAAVQSSGATVSTVKAAFQTAAGSISNSVSTTSTVTVTPATFKPGDTVQVSVTYSWVTPANWATSSSTSMFQALSMTGSGSIRVLN